MFQVAFTGTKVALLDNDGPVEENGWVDPDWSMFGLNEDREDVTVFEFETREEALEKIVETIGSVEDGERGTYYAQDAWEDYRTGDRVMLAGHITEI